MNAAIHIEADMMCLVVSSILLASTMNRPKDKAATQVDTATKLYQQMLVASIVAAAADMAAGLSYGKTYPAVRIALWMNNMFFYSAVYGLGYLWVRYSMQVLFGKINRMVSHICGCVFAAVVLLILTTPWHGLLFTLDEQDLFRRGSMLWVYWLCYVPFILVPSIIAPFTIIDKEEKTAVMVFALPMVITTILQIFVTDITVCQTGMTCALLLLYIMLQSKAVKDAVMRVQILDVLSTTDMMTNMKNRRAYEQRIDDLHTVPWVATLFIDLNGLKRVNDEQGHKAGDEMICCFANLLKKYLPENNVFRISGDEFVAFFTNKTLWESMSDRIVHEIGHRASCGHAEGCGSEIITLIKQAETDMYRNKSKYYIENGINRRRE